MDLGSDLAGGSRGAALEWLRPAATDRPGPCRRDADRAADRDLPVLRVTQHGARECLRADPVPRDLPLRRLPPAVRGVQAGHARSPAAADPGRGPRCRSVIRNALPFAARTGHGDESVAIEGDEVRSAD